MGLCLDRVLSEYETARSATVDLWTSTLYFDTQFTLKRRSSFYIQSTMPAMSRQTGAAVAAFLERRRSTRLTVRVALVVCGDGTQFSEETCTLSLNSHGALITLRANIAIGQKVVVHNPDNWAERDAVVTRIGRCYAAGTEVGIEFTAPASDFWSIETSHRKDDSQL